MLYSLRFVNIPNILWRHNHHHYFVNKTKGMNELPKWRSTQSMSTRPASPVSGTYYTRHWKNAGLMLGQRLTNVLCLLGQRLVPSCSWSIYFSSHFQTQLPSQWEWKINDLKIIGLGPIQKWIGAYMQWQMSWNHRKHYNKKNSNTIVY